MAFEASHEPKFCDGDDDDDDDVHVAFKRNSEATKPISYDDEEEDDGLPFSVNLPQKISSLRTCSYETVKKRPPSDESYSFRNSVKKSKVEDEVDVEEGEILISGRFKRKRKRADNSFSMIKVKKFVKEQLALVENSIEECHRKEQVEKQRLESLQRDINKCSEELANKKIQVRCVREINQIHEKLVVKIEECSMELVVKEAQLCLMEELIGEQKLEMKKKEMDLNQIKSKENEFRRVMDNIDKDCETKEEELRFVSFKVAECNKEMRIKEKELEELKDLIGGQANKLESIKKQFEGLVRENESKVKQFEEQVRKLESREKKLEGGMEEFESKKKVLEGLVKVFEGLVKEFESKEREFQGQKEELKSEKTCFESRVKEYESKEKQLDGRIKEFKLEKAEFEGKVKEFESKEREFQGQKEELQSEKMCFESCVKELESKHKQLDSRMKEFESAKGEFKCKVKEFGSKEREFQGQKNELLAKKMCFESRVKELESKEKQLDGLMKEFESKMGEFEGKVKEYESKEEELKSQNMELKSEKMQFESRVKELESKENQLEGQMRELESKKGTFEGQVNDLESQKKNFESQVKKLESKVREFEKRVRELKSDEQQLIGRVKELKPKIKHFESGAENFETKEKKFEGQEKPLIKSFKEEEESDNQLSPNIEENSLQLVLDPSEQIDEIESFGNHLLDNLLATSDPSKVVLEIIGNPIVPRCGEGQNIITINGGHIALLVQLMRIEPDIKPHVREEAMKLALDLKAHVSENSQTVLGFLLITSIYGLVPSFNRDEVLKLFGFVAQHKIAVELSETLGLTDKISDFVQNLIRKEQHIAAVRFICAYDLIDKYQPFNLLREHMQNAKLISERSCKNTNSIEIKDTARDEEITCLKTVLDCISDNNLQSENLLKEIQFRIFELIRQKGK